MTVQPLESLSEFARAHPELGGPELLAGHSASLGEYRKSAAAILRIHEEELHDLGPDTIVAKLAEQRQPQED